jgi:hypothetical protein
VRRQLVVQQVFFDFGELKTKRGFMKHCLPRRLLDGDQVFSQTGALKAKRAFMGHCLLRRQLDLQQVFTRSLIKSAIDNENHPKHQNPQDFGSKSTSVEIQFGSYILHLVILIFISTSIVLSYRLSISSRDIARFVAIQ